MGKPIRGDNVIDWTFSEAPTADEPPGGAEWPPPRRPEQAPRPLAPKQYFRLVWLLPATFQLTARCGRSPLDQATYNEE